MSGERMQWHEQVKLPLRYCQWIFFPTYKVILFYLTKVRDIVAFLFSSWCLFSGCWCKFTPFFHQLKPKWTSECTQGKWTARGTSHLNKHFLSLGVILTCLSIITGFLQRKSKEKVEALHQSSWEARSNDVPHSSLKKIKVSPSRNSPQFPCVSTHWV